MKAKKKIRVGSDCSGWASEIHALTSLGLGKNIDHVFACDIALPAQQIIINNCAPRTLHRNIFDRSNALDTEDVDIYVAGFPCQPFSKAGKNLGLQDDRASVFDAVYDYIDKRRPTIFVLENVKNLVSKTHRDAFNRILRLLRDLGEYWIDSRVYNSLSYGVPQNRERLYIIGVKESAITNLKYRSRRRTYQSLIWEAYTRRPSIIDYLGYTRFSNLAIEKQIKHQLRSRKSLTNAGKKNLRDAIKRIRKEGGPLATCDYVVDLGNGRNKVHMMWEVCPTITKTRGGGQDYYLLSIAQRLSEFDMMKLQGLNPHFMRLDRLRTSELGQLAGNAMTIPVLAATLRATLIMTGMATAA